MKAKQTEKEFQSMVVSLAKLFDWLCYHTYDSRRSGPGFPDLVLAKRGRLIVAELKVGRGKPTLEQKKWLAAFGDAGVTAYTWRPEDWPQIQEVLTA